MDSYGELSLQLRQILSNNRGNKSEIKLDICLYFSKGDTRSWNRPSRTLPPQSTQPRNKAKSDDEDRDTINDFTESEADQGSSPIDNNGGSESVYNDTDSVVEEVKPVKRNLRKRTTRVYISNSEDDFEQCDHDDAKVLTPDSLSCNNTDTEQEDIEVSAMFNSMVSVSERRSSSPIAVNDPLVVYNVFTGLLPELTF
ncbi:hypothetical protein AAF712_008090 [Marasmius tenuissimus]|uniref:Uncharacterized protein n=1 Tax=Marasmius tenuissimus TaxID=585030 RepID=A0ABR2ZV42_9AGAR